VRAFELLVLKTCCTINLVVRREAVFSSLRSQLVLAAVDLELETLPCHVNTVSSPCFNFQHKSF